MTDRPKAKFKAGRWLRLVLSLGLMAVIGFFIYRYVSQNFDRFRDLWQRPLSPWLVAAMVGLYTINLLVNSELTRLALTAQNIRLKAAESLALIGAATAANYVTPFKGGFAIRIIYLKRYYQLSIPAFLAQFAAVGFLTAATAAFVGLIGLLLMAAAGQPASGIFMGYFGVVASGAIVLPILLKHIPVLKKWPILNTLVTGWKLIASSPGLIRRLMFLQLGHVGSMLLLNYLGLYAFGVELSPGQAMFYTAGGMHLMAINLTPGGLGIQELYSFYLSNVLHFTEEQALMSQALIRAATFSVLLLTGLWSWWHLTRRHPGLKAGAKFRQAGDADIPALHSLFQKTLITINSADYNSAQIEAWSRRGTEERWRELMNSGLRFFMAEERSGRPLGFTAVSPTGYLLAMFVHHDYIQQGVGSNLMELAEGFARSEGAKSIFADVSFTAKPFFEKKGFVVEEEKEIEIEGIELTSFFMRKIL